MLVLGIESAGRVGGVALLRDAHLLTERLFERGMVHGRELAPAIDALCREHHITPREIDLIAVDIGPGSYTGLRVGLAAAKALSYATSRPVVGVLSLDAIAGAAAENVPAGTAVAAVMDARHDWIYGALYTSGNPVRRTLDPVAEKPAEFAARLKPETFVTGNALERYADLFRSVTQHWTAEAQWMPRPSMIAALGLNRFKEGNVDDPMTLAPLYLSSKP